MSETSSFHLMKTILQLALKSGISEEARGTLCCIKTKCWRKHDPSHIRYLCLYRWDTQSTAYFPNEIILCWLFCLVCRCTHDVIPEMHLEEKKITNSRFQWSHLYVFLQNSAFKQPYFFIHASKITQYVQ